MKKKGKIMAVILALLFVPGAIPAFIASIAYKFKKKKDKPTSTKKTKG